ncbi:xanthine dehydrogenase family protein molybdopterin-binding subunit [Phenylobacterium immobile]|uniref:xanthine dehydrogenase family protein molybdopterin-binding subunit n=1 Tax=Phenylobacterium immobile TaxID=21 RepID=UPI000B0C2209|nr:xanthine dehydrogenase family protein molybdopterin-binding subunit [Phenylobacterium immobile]
MSTVEDFQKPNPIKENRQGLIGKPVDRYDGPLKVAGKAPYAYEVQPPSPPSYGVMVPSGIAQGRIISIDTAAAEASPGVKAVWTYLNVPKHAAPAPPIDFWTGGPEPVFASDRVHYFGEPVAFVCADTLENATAAAQLIAIGYAADEPNADFHAKAHVLDIVAAEGDVRLGAFESAFAEAPVQLDDVWTTPVQNHCQMEPHASIAWWTDGICEAHTSCQGVVRSRGILAMTLEMEKEDILLRSRYIGGGFGGKMFTYADLILAALASRELGCPVKVAFTRQHMMHGTIHRPATEQRVRLGATPDGKLTALSLVGVSHASEMSPFFERTSGFAKSLYASPNRFFADRGVSSGLPPGGPLRAPGEASGTLSLEVAMDEMAEKLGLDPIEFRVINEPEVDPTSGKPFSIRQLVRCMREGAQMFGWDKRQATPGLVRDGRWLVGMGMAGAIRGNMLLPAKCSIAVDPDGIVTVRQGMTDIGTGTYTVLAQIAAETMGVAMADVRVIIGEAEAPPTPGSGGQFGAATAGSAALAAGMNLRRAIAALAIADPNSPLHEGAIDDVQFRDGGVAIGNRTESLKALISRAAPQGLDALGESAQATDGGNWSQHTFGAHFAEVGVDPITGETRLRRMLGVFACGRILNAKTARSQLTGGMIWGVSSALHEGNEVDVRFGSFLGQDLASYLVPVQADIGELDAIMLDEVDDIANPLGIKGVGELGMAGSGAAVANAVYNACGARVRSYPITPEKLIAALPQ